MIEKEPSCDDVVEPALMPVDEARRRLFKSLQPLRQVEVVILKDALYRVLSCNVESPFDVPMQANSAMDGYALNARSIPGDGEAALTLIGTAWAGKPYSGCVNEGQCIRIYTGAIMPDGADTVVIQEHARASSEHVDIDSGVVGFKNVRLAGEDVQAGQRILEQGRSLQASDIGVLASLGIKSVEVFKKLKVAFFTTGDELQALESHKDGEPLAPGMLFDSNRHTLAAMLSSLHVDTIDLGIVRDNEQETREALKHAADQADLVITSGGVSAGDADFVTRAFHDLGSVSFWKLAMRPGRPLAFGAIGDAAFFGLPGNPVAVMVTFLQFVKPAILHLSGCSDIMPLEIPARSLSSLRKSPGRVEYQRGVLSVDESGDTVVESTGKQGAGRLSSMSSANCLIVIASETDSVQVGDRVMVQPFHGLL
ncbi:MAG: molybdopterin molybdotransferase [Porticoccaceae bacterium]|jgi:molybdopterin molybdotransferase